MPTPPTVTGFEATQELGDGKKGLDDGNDKLSTAIVTGDYLAVGQTVNVWNTDNGYPGTLPNWTGTITGVTATVTLKCANQTVGVRGPQTTDLISVTVTDGTNGTSLTYNDPTRVSEAR
jgi:hypothetical protein